LAAATARLQPASSSRGPRRPAGLNRPHDRPHICDPPHRAPAANARSSTTSPASYFIWNESAGLASIRRALAFAQNAPTYLDQP